MMSACSMPPSITCQRSGCRQLSFRARTHPADCSRDRPDVAPLLAGGSRRAEKLTAPSLT